MLIWINWQNSEYTSGRKTKPFLCKIGFFFVFLPLEKKQMKHEDNIIIINKSERVHRKMRNLTEVYRVENSSTSRKDKIVCRTE